MKRKKLLHEIVIAALTAIFLVSCLFIAIAIPTDQVNQYPIAGKVIQTSRDTIKIKTDIKFFTCENKENCSIGDIVSCIVSDEGTPQSYDDIIIDTRREDYL